MAAVGEAGVDAGARTGTVVAVARVDDAFFGAGEKVCRVFGWKGHACGSHLVRLGGRRGDEFEVLLWLGEHVDGPGTDDAVRRAGDDVVGVRRANNVEGVDRVCVAVAGQWSFLHRCGLRARVPEKHLATVGAAYDEIRMIG